MDTHSNKGAVLRVRGKDTGEAILEHERALVLDPSNNSAVGELGFDYGNLGEFDKSLRSFDKAIGASPDDPTLAWWYGDEAWDDFGLKNYGQAIELARRAIATKPNNNQFSHVALVAALALTGREAEAR